MTFSSFLFFFFWFNGCTTRRTFEPRTRGECSSGRRHGVQTNYLMYKGSSGSIDHTICCIVHYYLPTYLPTYSTVLIDYKS
jgi:hypothetical protein